MIIYTYTFCRLPLSYPHKDYCAHLHSQTALQVLKHHGAIGWPHVARALACRHPGQRSWKWHGCPGPSRGDNLWQPVQNHPNGSLHCDIVWVLRLLNMPHIFLPSPSKVHVKRHEKLWLSVHRLYNLCKPLEAFKVWSSHKMQMAWTQTQLAPSFSLLQFNCNMRQRICGRAPCCGIWNLNTRPFLNK